jgi:hypothetical protein
LIYFFHFQQLLIHQNNTNSTNHNPNDNFYFSPIIFIRLETTLITIANTSTTSQMINPFLTGLTFISWCLGFLYDPQVFAIAFGLTIYLIIVTLFVAPTIPRGSLPAFDDIYFKAFCNCLKLKKLTDPEEHVIPAISGEATHLLFGLDTLWGLDTGLTKSIDGNQSDPKIVQYCEQTPLERSQRVYVDETSDFAKEAVADVAKEYITNHMQRVHSIPLAIQPSSYLLPTFNLEASVQTFVHFPLSAWNGVLTMVDMTMYFPAPRGARFFFETNIIGLRQHGADLFVDIGVVQLVVALAVLWVVVVADEVIVIEGVEL